MPKLVISLPDAGEVIHELTSASVTVGRIDSNSLQIEDPSVSSHHAEIVKEGSDYLLKDLGSTNGTFVNEEAVTSEAVKLSGGDHVRFGKVEAIFETEEKRKDPLPSAKKQKPALTRSEEAHRPESFGNIFISKEQKKDPLASVGWVLFVLALLAGAGVIFIVGGLQPPQL